MGSGGQGGQQNIPQPAPVPAPAPVMPEGT
jgi:hypothetical protein